MNVDTIKDALAWLEANGFDSGNSTVSVAVTDDFPAPQAGEDLTAWATGETGYILTAARPGAGETTHYRGKYFGGNALLARFPLTAPTR